MSATTDLFCSDCLPVQLSAQAQRNMTQKSEYWYLAHILATLAASLNVTQDAKTPSLDTAAVTDAASTAWSSAEGEFIEVINSGPDTVTILPRAVGDATNPTAGTVGIVLTIGAIWYPQAGKIKGELRAICGAGETASLTIISYS